MYFYIIQLFDYTYKEDILLALTSAGVMQGTYIEGENYDNILNNEFPLFTGLFKTKDLKERITSLFFGMVKDKKVMSNVEKLLHDAGIENKSDAIYRILVLKGE
jgi:hypothetical protein